MRRLVPALTITLVLLPAAAAGHEFEETRRLVLSVEPDHLELLVAYELRPGRLADGLRARFDAADDGRVDSAWERLARSRVIAPRLERDLAIELDGRRVRWRLADLAFLDPPREGGRQGIAAMALYRAPLGPLDGAEHPLRVGIGRGLATVEAQAAAPRRLSSEDLARRPDDPVLGPARLRPGRSVSLVLR